MQIPSYSELPDRFWSKVTPAENGCWLWTASVVRGGYGQFKIADKNHIAHRLSFADHYGKIPDGMNALHKCDVRNCVNPEHLYAGTAQDNVDDMLRRGRARPAFGEDHHHSKLTGEQVAEIRRAYKGGGVTQEALGREYGIAQSCVSKVVQREAWGHVH